MKLPAELTDFPAWDETMGATQYHYDQMPPGQRCGWTCRWLISSPDPLGQPGHKEVGYRKWLDGEQTEIELLCELDDYSNRPNIGAIAAEASTLINSRGRVPGWLWRRDAEGLILKVRETHKEYLYSPNEPRAIFLRNYRPGWDALFAKVKNEND